MSCKQHPEKKVECPICKAAIGQNCMMAPGTSGRYHDQRITLARGNSYITGERAPQEELPRMGANKTLIFRR